MMKIIALLGIPLLGILIGLLASMFIFIHAEEPIPEKKPCTMTPAECDTAYWESQ